MLSDTASTGIIEEFDALFLDLDGVVYRSGIALRNAVSSLNQAQSRGIQIRYLTNNASRTPEQVAANLQGFGLDVEIEAVITSAMTIARVMREQLDPGSTVYVVGAWGLEIALESEGLFPTRDPNRDISAVVQGHSPETTWGDLAEAGHLISSGVPWYASNTDASIPTGRGLAPGNGAFVRLLQELTGLTPTVAGKPHIPLFDLAATTIEGRVLMLGDRLDTDIEGANSYGLESGWVETGVHTINDVINAPVSQRPTFLVSDLSGLFRNQRQVIVDLDGSRCGEAQAKFVNGQLTLLKRGATREDDLRAVTALGWHIRDVGGFEGEVNATLDV